MTTRIIFVTLVSCIAVTSTHAADFKFDLVHTQVFFSASHLGYSHSTGHLAVKSGFFTFDDRDWSKSKIDATIDIASLDMGNAGWSDKLKSSYFDASTYPTAHYVSKSVEKNGDKTGIVHGTLTLLGRTSPVDLQVTFNRAGADGYTMHYIAGFSANATLKRSAFGMTRSDKDIGDDVTIHMEVEGIRDGDAQKESNAPEHH
ncbi:MAG TPA: YceI family protein [Rudaea sp.]|jgi:polyisoprenoid-binding protein YceI|nr:YceI family protein [Rudaea sp.]